MILITGVTGRVGGAAARALLRSDCRVRALVRDPGKVSNHGLAGLEIMRGNLAERASLRPALDGVESALLVTGNSEAQSVLEQNFVAEAAAAGVGLVVKISAMEAGPAARAAIPRLHYQTEQALMHSGMDWTLLRPNFFMQNLLLVAPAIAATDGFALPFGEAAVAPIDSDDVGEAAAAVLNGDGHAGRTYLLTGPSLVTFAGLAATLSEVCDRPVRYVDQDPEAFHATLTSAIGPGWQADAVAELFGEIRRGALARVSDDALRLLGRDPTPFAAFVERHRAAFG